MLKHLNPKGVAPPLGRYSHSVEAPPNARWLYISGQVGARPDGAIAPGFEAQAEQAWRNLRAVLENAGMGLGDLVYFTMYLTDGANLEPACAVRDRFIEQPPPAETLLIVAGLDPPELLFEISGVGAKA